MCVWLIMWPQDVGVRECKWEKSEEIKESVCVCVCEIYPYLQCSWYRRCSAVAHCWQKWQPALSHPADGMKTELCLPSFFLSSSIPFFLSFFSLSVSSQDYQWFFPPRFSYFLFSAFLSSSLLTVLFSSSSLLFPLLQPLDFQTHHHLLSWILKSFY